MMTRIDVLIPTCNRPAALAATMTSLCFQGFKEFDVVVSDQSDNYNRIKSSIEPIVRLLAEYGNQVRLEKNMPRKGVAQQRQFLLERSRADYCLFLDDDVILEPFVIGFMYEALTSDPVGFVGQALIGLSFKNDYRPQQQYVEFWEGPVKPEIVAPDDPTWKRHVLHNAANALHLQRRLGLTPEKPKRYKLAWCGGCVLYDRAKLNSVGGFGFWSKLPPEHAGEDVLVQQRLMKTYGGFGLLPSGAFHQELPTTVSDRRVDAPRVMSL